MKVSSHELKVKKAAKEKEGRVSCKPALQQPIHELKSLLKMNSPIFQVNIKFLAYL